MSRRNTVLLAAALIVGATLRLWNYTSIAPTNSDEATYLRHARFMATLARKALGLNVPVIAPEQHGIWRYVRKSDWSEKPCWLHSALMAVPMIFAGPSDAAGAVTNLFFSLACVLLVFVVCSRLEGPASAQTGSLSRFAGVFPAVASALLAVCFYWTLYSRSFWAEVDAAFFLLLAFYLLLRGTESGRLRLRLVAAAGIAAALAVLCHYRLLYVIGPLSLLAGLWAGKGMRMRAAVAMLAGFFGCLFLAAAVLRLGAMFAGGGVPFSGLIGALFERYFPQAGGVEQKGFQPHNLYAYGWYFVRNCGVALSLLTLAGLIALGLVPNSRLRRGIAGAALLAVAPFIVLICQVWVVARAIAVAIPFACILAAHGFAMLLRLAGRLSGFRGSLLAGIGVLLLLAALIENLIPNLRLARNRMGHKAVAEFLRRENPSVVFADRESAIIYGWYAPELRYESLRVLEQEPQREYPEGTYAVFDDQKWHTYPSQRKRITRLETELVGNNPPVMEVVSLTTAWREFLMDGTQAHTLKGMFDSIRKAESEGIGTIRVYRLKQLVSMTPGANGLEKGEGQ